jgi:hypothetical protein
LLVRGGVAKLRGVIAVQLFSCSAIQLFSYSGGEHPTGGLNS